MTETARGRVRIDWDAMSAWFKEDEAGYPHARDPFTGVDILSSSRRVRVDVDGIVVADSQHPRIAGLVSSSSERADISVGGVLQPRPRLRAA
jgi:hypothetical protein